MISRSFFLLINAGILAHVKKMKTDLDVLFFFQLPSQSSTCWAGVSGPGCQWVDIEAEPETASRRKLCPRARKRSRRGISLKQLLKTCPGVKLQDSKQECKGLSWGRGSIWREHLSHWSTTTGRFYGSLEGLLGRLAAPETEGLALESSFSLPDNLYLEIDLLRKTN